MDRAWVEYGRIRSELNAKAKQQHLCCNEGECCHDAGSENRNGKGQAEAITNNQTTMGGCYGNDSYGQCGCTA